MNAAVTILVQVATVPPRFRVAMAGRGPAVTPETVTCRTPDTNGEIVRSVMVATVPGAPALFQESAPPVAMPLVEIQMAEVLAVTTILASSGATATKLKPEAPVTVIANQLEPPLVDL